MMERSRALLCGLFLLLGAACSKPAAPVAAAPKAAAPAAAKKPEPAPAVAPDAGIAADQAPYIYAYNPLGKRDPFRNPIEEVRVSTVQSAICSEPLCQWDLTQLNLVAVVTGDANPLAMVQDPDSKGYVVRRGSKMGKQGGKVTQILRDSITVTEYWTGPDGKVNPNPVVLNLKAEKTFSPVYDLVTGKEF